VTWYTNAAQRQASAAVRVVHRQGLILRLTQRAEPPVPRLSDYFAPLAKPVEAPDPTDRSPAAMVAAAASRAANSLPQVQQALLDAVACFQGNKKGSQAHAVDQQRLVKAWRANETGDAPQQITPDFAQAREAANELLTGRLDVLLNRYRAAVEGLVSAVRTLVGNDADISLVAPLRQLVLRARQVGLFPVALCSASEAERAVDVLASDEAKSVLRHAVSFNAPDNARSADVQLAAWASMDLDTLVKVNGALTLLEGVVNAIQRAAGAELEATGTGDVATMVVRLQKGLAEVIDEVNL
jgi:hypothetical protein